MIPASQPVQRPRDAKLLVIDDAGNLRHVPRSSWVEFLRAGDLVVANDAATIPASLSGGSCRHSQGSRGAAGRPPFARSRGCK